MGTQLAGREARGETLKRIRDRCRGAHTAGRARCYVQLRLVRLRSVGHRRADRRPTPTRRASIPPASATTTASARSTRSARRSCAAACSHRAAHCRSRCVDALIAAGEVPRRVPGQHEALSRRATSAWRSLKMQRTGAAANPKMPPAHRPHGRQPHVWRRSGPRQVGSAMPAVQGLFGLAAQHAARMLARSAQSVYFPHELSRIPRTQPRCFSITSSSRRSRRCCRALSRRRSSAAGARWCRRARRSASPPSIWRCGPTRRTASWRMARPRTATPPSSPSI